jgi:hypothetical protein
MLHTSTRVDLQEREKRLRGRLYGYMGCMRCHGRLHTYEERNENYGCNIIMAVRFAHGKDKV